MRRLWAIKRYIIGNVRDNARVSVCDPSANIMVILWLYYGYYKPINGF